MSQVFLFDGLPGRTLHVWLLRRVQNSRCGFPSLLRSPQIACSEIQRHVQSQTFEPECSFINAALVADAWLVQLAAFKALAAQSRGAMKTRSLHGELVHNLSGTKHIGESFKRYGISDQSPDLLVCRFDLTDGEEPLLLGQIRGDLEPLTELRGLTDITALQKFHKWTPAEMKLGDVTGAIATKMAARDC